MLLFCRTLTRERICFQSESGTSAELFKSLFKAVFHIELSESVHIRKNGTVLHSYDIEGETASAVFDALDHASGHTRTQYDQSLHH